jgi:hypothetical protein
VAVGQLRQVPQRRATVKSAAKAQQPAHPADAEEAPPKALISLHLQPRSPAQLNTRSTDDLPYDDVSESQRGPLKKHRPSRGAVKRAPGAARVLPSPTESPASADGAETPRDSGRSDVDEAARRDPGSVDEVGTPRLRLETTRSRAQEEQALAATPTITPRRIRKRELAFLNALF